MKCVRRLGIAGLAVSLLAACRPASATDIVFSFTAQQVINAINSDPHFGLGGTACGNVEASFASYCGVFDITFIPNVAGATITDIGGPSPTPAADWQNYIYGPDGAQGYSPTYGFSSGGADFNADMEYQDDQYVSFLTTNGNTFGKDYYNANSYDSYVIGTTPLASSTVFSFTVSTSASAAVASGDGFTLVINAEPLNADGTDNTSLNADGKWFDDESITNFAEAPEPVSGWLCLIGLAAWGMYRKRRLVRAELPSPPDIVVQV